MAEDKLDIEEANRIRVSLGMQPLPTQKEASGKLNFKPSASKSESASDDDDDDDEEEQGSTLESRQALASANWQNLQAETEEKKKREEKRAALKKERDAAQRFAKLEGKGLGDADDDNQGTKSWLLGSQKRQKRIAKQRARQLEQELAERENQVQYTAKDLAGTRVAHEVNDFDAGEEQVLTLKDAAVDAEDEDDELENVGVREKEELRERLELKKKKPVYDPNEAAEEGQSSILGQYDEEIEGKKQKRFTLNESGLIDGQGLREAGTSTSRGTKISLDFMPDEKPNSDYQDISEIKVKKPKKKKDKSKKRQREDDMLAPDEADQKPAGDAEQMDIDVPKAGPTPNKRKFGDTSLIDDDDLQSNLAMQRRAALKKRKKTAPEDLARQIRQEAFDPDDGQKSDELEEGGLVLDETSEFVSNLQKPQPRERRTSAPAGKPSHAKEQSESPAPDADGDIEMAKAYNEIDEEHNLAPNQEASAAAPEGDMTGTGLDEEEAVNTGLGSTLSMLTKRGLLKTAESGDVNAVYRERQRFLHEKQQREAEAERKARLQRERDRASGKFDRMSARERETYAQRENNQRDQLESRQMADVFNREYKPNIDLKYVDEFGRHMGQKEAFKHLSHQFHGKGSGKQKTEKMLKKVEDEKKKEAASMLDSRESTGMDRATTVTAKKNRQAGVRLQ
ncbi:MAG: hypothetical protein M1831_001478 [Alyxoria varia]|nr:MAG: hypothetical protein M1831_001478 [Alyxoria varia]